MVTPPSPLPVTSSSSLEGPVVNPTERDVHLGRGRGCANHFGNTLLEDLIKAYTEQYANASELIGTKGKKLVSTSIVGAIHRNGGRFIKYCPNQDVWMEVPESVARVKVAQALKYRCRKLNASRRSQEEGGSMTTTIEELPDRSSSILTKITAATTMQLMRSIPGGRAANTLPSRVAVPSTPQSMRRTPTASPTSTRPFSSPPPTARTAVAVTPYSPTHRQVVDFRYQFRGGWTSTYPPPPPSMDPSPMASSSRSAMLHRDPTDVPLSPPHFRREGVEDDEISITSMGNDAFVAESMVSLIQDYIAVPSLSSSNVTDGEEEGPLPVVAQVETPPRPSVHQRNTALSAKALHDVQDHEESDPSSLPPVYDK